MFITKDNRKYPISISVKFFHALESIEKKLNRNINNRANKELLLEFEVLRFYPSKDPPR